MTAPCGNSSRVVLGVGLAVLLGFLIFKAGPGRQPQVNGHTARYWTQQLVRDAVAARKALIELGPASVPELIRAVELAREPQRGFLHSIRHHLPRFARRFVPSRAETELRGMRAVELLYDLGTNAAPAVAALIHVELGAGPLEITYAPSALARIGAGGVPYLTEVLRTDSPEARVKAAAYLAALGPQAGGAGRVLGANLEHPDPQVRFAAMMALARIGPPAVDALPALRSAVLTGDPDLRLRAIEALWNVGHEAEPGLPTLIAILEDANHPGRADAATILGSMGPAAKPALSALTHASEGTGYASVKAREALRQLESPRPPEAKEAR